MKRWLELGFLCLILIALLGALFVRFQETHPSPVAGVGEMMAFEARDQGIRFNYPATFALTAIDSQAAQAGTFFRATQGTSALISVRREAGLGLLKLAGGSIIDILRGNVDRQYPGRYPDYEKVIADEGRVGPEPSARQRFTYTGADDETVIQSELHIVVMRDNDAYFFTFQAPQEQFASHEVEFDAVLASVKFFEPVIEKETESQ